MAIGKDLKKIPQDIIDALIEKADILEIVSRDVKLKKEGNDYIGLCPFHDEKSPSFSVSPKKQFYYCFGCGASGNALNFIMQYHNRPFISVIQDLADQANEDITMYLAMSGVEDAFFKLAPALKEAAEYFHGALVRDSQSKGMNYLRGRQIPDNIIDQYQLGFAGYGKTITTDLQKHSEPLTQAGVFEQGDHGVFSQFRDRVIMPIRDIRGKVIAISGRALQNDVKPKYKNSKETPLFSRNNTLYGLYEALEAAKIKDSDVSKAEKLDLIHVVEGQVDVLGMRKQNLDACASMGSSLSVNQLRLLLRCSNEIVFVFDGDKAGIKALIHASTTLLNNLTSLDVPVYVVFMPEGEDPGSLEVKDPELLLALLKDKKPWLESLFTAIPEYKLIENGTQGCAEYSAAAIDIIHGTRDPLLKHMAIELISKHSKFPVSVLNERLISMPAHRSGQAVKTQVAPTHNTDDAPIRLARILWDEPIHAEFLAHPEIWMEDEDELISTMGTWIKEMKAGKYDIAISDADGQAIANKTITEKEVLKKNRSKGAAAGFGRMLTLLEPHVMQKLMAEEPESAGTLATSLMLHITINAIGVSMQRISENAALNLSSDAEREKFRRLLGIKQDCQKRMRT